MRSRVWFIGGLLEQLRHQSGVANLDVYWARTKFEAHTVVVVR